jgi:hypothetical protein
VTRKFNPGSAAYLKGSLFWHIDGTMNERPILASLLQCEKPSPKGTGNTGFSNTYSAYEALPEEKKAEIADYRVRHGAWASLFYYDPEPSQEMLERMQSIGDVELPLVWSHKSGRKRTGPSVSCQRSMSATYWMPSSPSSLVRTIIRPELGSYHSARCIVPVLSQITRSPAVHSWL